MKSTRIKTFIFAIYFFALFFNNIFQIKAAEAPDGNSSDDLSEEHVTHIAETSNPIYALVDSLVVNYYERNLFAEFILVELSIYISLLLRLLALVNPEDVEDGYLPLKHFFVSFLLNSTFERRKNMVSKEKIEKLEQSSRGKYVELRDKLSQQMHGNSVKLFDTALTNKDEIQENIDFLLNMLLVLFEYGIERFLGSAAITLFSFFDSFSLVLTDFSNIFSSSPRKEISSRFISNKDFVSYVDFDFCYNRVESGSLQENVVNSAQEQFTNQIIDSSSPNIEELCKIKEILLTALDLLKTGLFIVFIFERSTFYGFLSQIHDKELKIKKELEKINCDGLSEQKYLELKVDARNLFDIGGVHSNNLVIECYDECLPKETLTSSMASVYKSLLSAMLVLRNYETTTFGVDFLKLLFEIVLTLFEEYTKKCAQQIKKIRSLAEVEVQNLQISTVKEKFKMRKELYKQSLMVQAEIERKENKERKLREKKVKEEKERLERERLSEANKNKEKKPRKKKTKPKKVFPIVEDSTTDTSKEDVGEAQTSASSYASQEVSSKAKEQVCRPKLNRKEEKLRKLLKEEQKSLQREEVKKTILEQKCSNISTRKRKQGERKIKNENRREKEERERLEEKEREMEREREKRERMKHSNYMYTLLNSISAIEGLFAEAEKSRASISGLISFVFQIISEEKVETEEASSEKGISDMFASLSVSETVTPQQQASGLSRTGMELGARPKTSVGGPKPRSSSSSSSSSKSSARRRSKSRSRSRRSSRSRARSSRSRARSSRSRGRSRSRDKSSEVRALTFDGFEVPDSIFSSTVHEDPNKSSKFLKYFQVVNGLDSQDSSVFEQKYLEYEQQLIDLSVITQDSLEDEILNSLELCGNLIQTLHTVVIPLVRGKELMYLQLLERAFVKFFIKFLIFLQQKKDE
ncbi:Fruit fly transformer family protein [Cryptosporidium hominis]|uniref:Secreted Protein (SKSR family) n=1 Tax=Cryptosporidium hominis TaxID=237895 RepID=A0ABX5BFB8_CRYHO|nr:hypothetical protein ChTU502y2012_376g0010 [Cryptosporidium hominis]PPA62572.1 Fruit fly transformer family protein [Cryptosporidium hominis]PPS97032.1 putative Secreted Protein (SKSR family) [Cryptosporidium hominis]|eukprot:PPS97032.1 putative Secreted Protein (SKSR family) [Cryptosporidium hominis]